MHVAALNIHPVKSLRGLAVDTAEVDLEGLAGDRRFMVVDPKGNFLTQRTLPRMARVDALLQGGDLVLRCAGFGELRVARAPSPVAALLKVSVWKSEGLLAEDCGQAPADWLAAVLEVPCRLVRAGPAFHRLAKGAAATSNDRVAFADAYPLLVASEASLADLNARIPAEPVPMNRFRANIVVAGCAAYAEDAWRRIRIGRVVLRAAGPCARCVVTTTDQQTGVRAAEPLRALADYRRDPAEPTHVNFAQNYIHETKQGVLRVGDPVEVIE